MTSFTLSGAGWSHEVVVGGIEEAAESLRRLCGNTAVPLVTDQRLLDLHGPAVRRIIEFTPIVLTEGEAAKNWETLQLLISSFSELGLTRDRPVVALGGGSVGDVAGLAAALFKRGCPLIHLPTTLLAQVDSTVGGKTAIDAFGQKNLVGAFHPPALVVCDPAFLDTLDRRQLRAGYAEVVKYGLIDDPDFFRWCETNGQALLDGNNEARRKAVEHCLKSKARLIGDDLRDLSGKRALLNLGHTFGHAIEGLRECRGVLHGEAVGAGMALAFGFSVEQGHCPDGDLERLLSHLRSVGLPTSLSDVGLAGRGPELMPFLRQDKKAQAAGLVLILAHGIGKAFVARDVPQDRLADFLEKSG